MGEDGQFTQIEEARGVKLEDEAARYEARDEISSIVSAWIEARDYTDVASSLETAGALWSGYQTFRQSLNDPYLYSENPMFKQMEQPGLGSYPIPGAPMWFEGLKRLDPAPAPRFGQHTDEVLGDVLGLASGQIGALHDKGVVRGLKG